MKVSLKIIFHKKRKIKMIKLKMKLKTVKLLKNRKKNYRKTTI